ncbi:MAG: hypothetical protein GQ569_09220 [Methylococcaceae bacterium]|nr:hypothetical protein [Methylococcaceae bacterium]
MQATINFDDNQLKNLMFYTHSENESEAVCKAVEVYLQLQEQKQNLLLLRGQGDKEELYEREKQEDAARWANYQKTGQAVEQIEMLAWMDNLSERV